MKKTNNNIIFESKRKIDKFKIFLIGFIIISLIIAEILLISDAVNKNPKLITENIINENLITNKHIEKIINSSKINDTTEKKKLLEKLNNDINKEKKEIEKNRKSRKKSIIYFTHIIMFLFITFLIKILFNIFYKNKVKFYITENQIIIEYFKSKDYINIDEILNIELLGKVNLVGLFYNIDKDAIVINLKNENEKKYIIAKKGTYENICELLNVLKKEYPNKLIIKPVFVKNKKHKGLILGIIFGFYVITTQINKSIIYGLIFGVSIILSSIIIFNKEEKNECMEIYKIDN